jgi:hypothetical protein
LHDGQDVISDDILYTIVHDVLRKILSHVFDARFDRKNEEDALYKILHDVVYRDIPEDTLHKILVAVLDKFPPKELRIILDKVLEEQGYKS